MEIDEDADCRSGTALDDEYLSEWGPEATRH
jgi:hypothetical protein